MTPHMTEPSPRRFGSGIAVTGIGRSEFEGATLAGTWSERATGAARAAIADAGLSVDDVDGLCVDGGSTGMPGLSEGGARGVMQAMDIRPTWHCGARDTPGAVIDAVVAVAAGLCRHVLCLTVVRGTPPGTPRRAVTADPSAGSVASPAERRAAHACAEYLATFGHARTALGWVSIAARRHALRNPDALRRAPLRMEDYLGADPVDSPLGVADYGTPRGGAVGLVVSAAEVARDRPHHPVWIDAVGTRRSGGVRADWSLSAYRRNSDVPAAHLWSRASVVRKDVDFLVLDDSSTFDVLCWLEALGFCAVGEAPDFVQHGTRIGPDGVLPVNPHGGRLAAADCGGYANLHEVVVQLRGQADGRQIPGACVAVASSGAARPGSAMILLGDAHLRSRN
jgi:hypothetical protein